MKNYKKFYWADLHFNHYAIIKYCNRQYKTVEEMNRDYISRWNATIAPHDRATILGDFVWNTTPKREIAAILDVLNGKKDIVLGNHDGLTIYQCIKLGFNDACYEKIVKIAGEYVRLSHYPYQYSKWKNLNIPWYKKILFSYEDKVKHWSKRPKNDGKWLVHGHNHPDKENRLRGKQINVGADAWENPVGEWEIARIIQRSKNG